MMPHPSRAIVAVSPSLDPLIGTVGAVGVSRLLESLLYGVKPGDAMTFAGVLVLLTGVAAVA